MVYHQSAWAREVPKPLSQWGGGHPSPQPTPSDSCAFGASTHACGTPSLGASSFLEVLLRPWLDHFSFFVLLIAVSRTVSPNERHNAPPVKWYIEIRLFAFGLPVSVAHGLQVRLPVFVASSFCFMAQTSYCYIHLSIFPSSITQRYARFTIYELTPSKHNFTSFTVVTIVVWWDCQHGNAHHELRAVYRLNYNIRWQRQ